MSETISSSSKEQILEYSELIRKQACPSCKKTDQKLNASIISSHLNTRLKIACPKCLYKASYNANIASIIFGLLRTPWGWPNAYKHIKLNFGMMKLSQLPEPTNVLIGFIKRNISWIEENKNDSFQLRKIITLSYDPNKKSV